MTVTALRQQPRGQRPTGRPTPRRLTASRRLNPDAQVTLTFEVNFAGDTRHRDALDLVDAVHQLAEQLDAQLSIAAGPIAPAPPAPVPPPFLDVAEIGPDAIVVEDGSRSVRRGANPIPFTKIEYDLLHFLAAHPRQLFTRRQLLLGVWGHQHAGERTVDVHIRRLRAKLGDGLITTVRSVGYRLADDASVHLTHPAVTLNPVPKGTRE
jgi:DNA-binding winged helix-turn-helix (wHTH) protein